MLSDMLSKYLIVFGILIVAFVMVALMSYNFGLRLKDAECKTMIEQVVNDEREKFKKLIEIRGNVPNLPDSEFNKWLLDNGHATL